MIFSESWLREFVDPGMSTAELVETLTMAGLEVDNVTSAASQFSGVVVGRVESAEQHPDADKLSVCRVTDGVTDYQVVCGAPNVRPGLLVPFAKVGAVLEGGEKPFKIKAAKLRGVESNGMLCSAEELGLAESSDGLLELPETLTLGEDIRVVLDLDDKLIELDLTPNRGDCLGMIGLAREVGVLAGAGSNNTQEAVRASAHAREAGATAVLLVDCYYNGPSSLELRTEYYERILEQVPEIPIMPYVIPGRSGCALAAADLAILHLNDPKRVPAVKQATGDLDRMRLDRKLAGPALSILSGDDDLTLTMMRDQEIAACGVVSVVSNIAPGAIGSLVRAQGGGDSEDAEEEARE